MTGRPEMPPVVPHLVCADAAAEIDFLVKAFGAVEHARLKGESGKIIHALVTINGGVVMLVDAFPDMGSRDAKAIGDTPVSVHLTVPNADEAAKSAVAAGAKMLMEVDDQFWGDRFGYLEDPQGHRWSVAHKIRDVSDEEIETLMQSGMQTGAPENA